MQTYDVAIVGGSHAGLSAALILGRARRKVILIDAGEPRNAPAGRAYGFSTRDATPPAELRRLGREELRPYDVALVEARAEHVTGHDLDFTPTLNTDTQDSGQRVRARKLVLATGVRDDLGILPGLSDLWGRRAYTCPYCHGWEVRDEPLAVIGSGEEGVHYASLVSNWSPHVTLCTDGAGLEPPAVAHLTQLGIQVIDAEIERLSEDRERASVHFKDAPALRVAGVFIRPPVQLVVPLADALGCNRSDETYLWTDETGQTSVRGVYAVGDLVSPEAAVILAAASGANAAYMLNHQFVSEQQTRGATHA